MVRIRKRIEVRVKVLSTVPTTVHIQHPFSLEIEREVPVPVFTYISVLPTMMNTYI